MTILVFEVRTAAGQIHTVYGTSKEQVLEIMNDASIAPVVSIREVRRIDMPTTPRRLTEGPAGGYD